MKRYILILALALALLPTLASAHAELVRTEPAAGAQLADSPQRVRVFFSEPVETAFSSLRLFDVRGQQVGAAGERAADDPKVLELVPPPLEPGIYTAVWQITSSDSHIVKGNFAFTVLGAGGDLPPEQAAPHQETPVVAAAVEPSPLLPALLRALMLLGALVAVGGWVVFVGEIAPVLPPGSQERWRLLLRRCRVILLAALALTALTSLAMLLLHTSVIAGALDAANIGRVAAETRYGQALLARVVLSVVLAGLLLPLHHAGSVRVVLLMALGGALLMTFSTASHAATQPQPGIDITLDWLHLLATAFWVGGLTLLALLLPPLSAALTPEERPPVVEQIVSHFSAGALGSVLVLTLTGTYAALQHIATPAALVTSDYGRALLLKLALFGGLLLFGAYNLLRLRPQLARWAVEQSERLEALRQRLQWSLRGEVLLALLVILAVGFLTTLAPPADPSLAAAQPPAAPANGLPPTRTRVPSVPFDQTVAAADLQVRLQVRPASLGENQLAVTLTDAAGERIEVQLVRLRLTMMEMDMGETILEAEQMGGAATPSAVAPSV